MFVISGDLSWNGPWNKCAHSVPGKSSCAQSISSFETVLIILGVFQKKRNADSVLSKPSVVFQVKDLRIKNKFILSILNPVSKVLF